MKTRLLLFAFLLGGTLPPAFALTPMDKKKLQAELVKMENDFCAAAAAQGAPAAFAQFAAPDVAFFDVDPREHRGAEAVRLRMTDYPAGAKLTWAPIVVDVADSGDLGYTWGRYEFRAPQPDGTERVRGGFYCTIWKRQPDGTWKYVFDNGAADRPAPSPAAPPPAGARQPAAGTSG